jgi:opacity protein-like surface antigen
MSFRACKRLINVCGALAVLSFALMANAAPQDALPPGSDVAEEPEKKPLPPCPVPEQAPAPAPTAAAPAPPPEPAPPPPAPAKRPNVIFAPQTISVTAGAGVGDYFGSGINTRSDPGAAWDARLTFGTRSVIALEAGYVGSVNPIDTDIQNAGRLNSHGIDGDLRLQLPTRVQPYIFSGVGYNHMSVTNKQSVIGGQLSDNQVTVPAGAGLTGYLGRHVTLDLRGTYRYIPDNDVTIMSTNRALHQWVAQAHVGWAF